MARRASRRRERCHVCSEPLTTRHAATPEQRLLLAIFGRPVHVCRYCADRLAAGIDAETR